MHYSSLPANTEVIYLQGHLNASNATELQERLAVAVASMQNRDLLVDMGLVESIDSAGLMALVSALKQAQSRNRKLLLSSVSPSVRIIFELTQLDRVFGIVDSAVALAAA